MPGILNFLLSRTAVLMLLAPLLAGGGGGCVHARVHPPCPLALNEPVLVFLVDTGVHSALLLPMEDGRYVEYSYGDWAYAVENHDSLANAFAALTMSLQAGLGRRMLVLEPEKYPPSPWLTGDRIQRIYVERDRVEALIKDLDARYRASATTQPTINELNAFAYVRDPLHYSVLNNCNHLTGASLRKLGCVVEGPNWHSKYYLASERSSGSAKACPPNHGDRQANGENQNLPASRPPIVFARPSER